MSHSWSLKICEGRYACVMLQASIWLHRIPWNISGRWEIQRLRCSSGEWFERGPFQALSCDSSSRVERGNRVRWDRGRNSGVWRFLLVSLRDRQAASRGSSTLPVFFGAFFSDPSRGEIIFLVGTPCVKRTFRRKPATDGSVVSVRTGRALMRGPKGPLLGFCG